MDSGPAKRRKLDHTKGGSEKALQAVASVGMSRSRTFILEAEELLDEVGLDYATAFGGADELLRQIKGSIEAIEAHDTLLVCCAVVRWALEKVLTPAIDQRGRVATRKEAPAQSSVPRTSTAKYLQLQGFSGPTHAVQCCR